MPVNTSLEEHDEESLFEVARGGLRSVTSFLLASINISTHSGPFKTDWIVRYGPD